MALGRLGDPRLQGDAASLSRAIELVGDSPEIVALALLRQIAQTEQQAANDKVLRRKWLLDTYAECLAVVRGTSGSPASVPSTSEPRGRKQTPPDEASSRKRS